MKGATPVPGPIMMIGVIGDAGSLKVESLMNILDVKLLEPV